MQKNQKLRGMRMVRRLFALLLSVLLLSGCSVRRGDAPPVCAPSQDQRLELFTCLEDSLCGPLVREFQELTGIWVEVTTGTPQALLKLLEEDPDCCDLLLGVGADVLLAREVPMTQWQTLSLRLPVIVYNPMLIRQNPPQAITDLLLPAWQGKIAFADPASSDFSLSLLYLLTELSPSRESGAVLHALGTNLTELCTDPSQAAAQVSDGEYCLALVPEHTALAAQDQGATLTLVYPREGAFPLPDCAAIPQDAPHPENARLFLSFCRELSTQSYMQRFHHRRSPLPELADGTALAPFDLQAAALALPQLLALWESEVVKP